MELLTAINLNPLALFAWITMGAILAYYWLSSFGLFK
jgi:hypothetical protein